MYDQAQNTNMIQAKNTFAIRTRSSNKKLLKITRPRTEKFKKSLAYIGKKKKEPSHGVVSLCPE